MEVNKDREDREMNSTPVFHYSREHRLSRASPAVQALYEDGAAAARPGILKKMFVTKRNSSFFILILLICVMMGFIGRVSGGTDKSVKLSGNTVTSAIINTDGVLILDVIKKVSKKGGAYSGAVDIAVSPVMSKTKNEDVMELPPVFSHRVTFTSAGSEAYSVSLPFEETEFFVIFRTGDDHKSLRLKAVEAK